MRENETIIKSRHGHDRLFFYEDSEWFVDLGECLYIGLTVDDDGHTIAIDPDGGPYIAIGDKLSDYNLALPDIRVLNIVRQYSGYYQLT